MVDVMRRELLEVQFEVVLDFLHAFGGLYTMLGSLVATGVVDGTKPIVAEG
jgi:hypothetical protein